MLLSVIATGAALAGALPALVQGPRRGAADGPYAGADAPAWNRVHRALFLRTDSDGERHGARALDPLLFPGSDWLLEEERAGELATAVDALAVEGATPRARAVMQRDLWAAHDWLTRRGRDEPEAERLRRGIAGAIGRLGLDARARGVLDRELRAADAALPEELAALLAFPHDADEGPWVRLAPADGGAPLARHHAAHFGARAAFSVHVRTPGGRAETLEWLARLRAAEPTVEVDGERRLAADLPQPPAGTLVALVRRAVHLDAGGRLHVLPLVELVQLRTFPRTAPPPGWGDPHAPVDGARLQPTYWTPWQEVTEHELDRAGLLSGGAPLREVGPDEPDLSTFASHGDPFAHGDPPMLHPRLAVCTSCHGAPGVHSMAAFTGTASGAGTQLQLLRGEPPRGLVPDTLNGADTRALEAARRRPEFVRLMESRDAR